MGFWLDSLSASNKANDLYAGNIAQKLAVTGQSPPPRLTPLPYLLPYVSRVGSGTHLVGRRGSGAQVSFNKFPAGFSSKRREGYELGGFVWGMV